MTSVCLLCCYLRLFDDHSRWPIELLKSYRHTTFFKCLKITWRQTISLLIRHTRKSLKNYKLFATDLLNKWNVSVKIEMKWDCTRFVFGCQKYFKCQQPESIYRMDMLSTLFMYRILSILLSFGPYFEWVRTLAIARTQTHPIHMKVSTSFLYSINFKAFSISFEIQMWISTYQKKAWGDNIEREILSGNYFHWHSLYFNHFAFMHSIYWKDSMFVEHTDESAVSSDPYNRDR